ncbi:cysteine-rich DPF motif domain-containing protein 1 [Calliphora vicina]|uniref:cysteine-rich DPF motif domain-containing protein 1 n=1 Tax=Calliphora vicina TaxID=7373 RepID=UPI00325C1B44
MSLESPTPSCSKSLKEESQTPADDNDDDGNSELYIKNDKAEIELLESTDTKTKDKDEKPEVAQDDERIAKIKFYCSCCDMEEMAHYFGLEPSFVFGIKFNEPTYIMRDPFQAPPPRWKAKAEYFVALGAHCKICENVVCKDSECSFFYINSYCLNCVKKVASTFPLDIQQKLRKQMAMN